MLWSCLKNLLAVESSFSNIHLRRRRRRRRRLNRRRRRSVKLAIGDVLIGISQMDWDDPSIRELLEFWQKDNKEHMTVIVYVVPYHYYAAITKFDMAIYYIITKLLLLMLLC